MKNYIPATFLLTLIVVGVLMGLYFLPSMSVGGKPLRKVDLLADIRPDVEEEVCDSDTIVLPPPVKPIFVDTCKTGITCIEDYSDSTMRGMKHFYEALSKVKTMKRPVRIAYFGDSFIEADIFTADLREMLQQEFGGCGVGYVPVTFNELTDDEAFWKGCEGCINHDILVAKNRKFCICTAMLYDPALHEEDTI